VKADVIYNESIHRALQWQEDMDMVSRDPLIIFLIIHDGVKALIGVKNEFILIFTRRRETEWISRACFVKFGTIFSIVL
jgi:hypothetical protein